MHFTKMRNKLMKQHGWSRCVATLAARYYLGIDKNLTSAITFAGKNYLSSAEIHQILRVRCP